MNKEFIGGIVGTTVSAVGTASQPNAGLEKLSLILTIVGTCLTIVMTLIALINWWKNAKKDGKIDKEEKEEGKNIFKKLIDGFKSLFSIFKKDKEDNEE